MSFTKNNPNTIFEFKHNIAQVGLYMPQDVLDGETISNTYTGTKQLTVTACKTLIYNYYVN